MRDIDTIIASLVAVHPGIAVEQLKVAHPGAGDDGLWFFRHLSSPVEAQLQSSTGQCPFIFESDACSTTSTAPTTAEAVALVQKASASKRCQSNYAFKRTVRVEVSE